MAYQLTKTGAEINTKLQELTVRTAATNTNIAATDGIIIVDATSGDVTVRVVDANMAIGQRVSIVAKNMTNVVMLDKTASEAISGCGEVNSTGMCPTRVGDIIEIMKVATNVYYIIRNFGWASL